MFSLFDLDGCPSLKHWGRDNMAAISMTTLSNAFFFNENVLISIKISLKFVPKGPINNIQALVQIMAWRRPGDKPLSEAMMVSLLTHICVTWPQWVKYLIKLTRFASHGEFKVSQSGHFIMFLWQKTIAMAQPRYLVDLIGIRAVSVASAPDQYN